MDELHNAHVIEWYILSDDAIGYPMTQAEFEQQWEDEQPVCGEFGEDVYAHDPTAITFLGDDDIPYGDDCPNEDAFTGTDISWLS